MINLFLSTFHITSKENIYLWCAITITPVNLRTQLKRYLTAVTKHIANDTMPTSTELRSLGINLNVENISNIDKNFGPKGMNLLIMIATIQFYTNILNGSKKSDLINRLSLFSK
jgi:hypothetical protein